jgi:V-type H+-transporting ATPase subunit a
MYTFQNYEEFRKELKKDQNARKEMRTDYFDMIETEIENEEKELDQFLQNKSENFQNLNSLIENREILKKLSKLTYLDPNINMNNSQNSNSNYSILNNEFAVGYEINQNQINDNSRILDGDFRGGLQFISGVILAENELKLRRTVFRVSYGLGLTTFWDIDQNIFEKINQYFDATSKSPPKKIFTICLKNSSDGDNYLLGKLIKICDTLGASRYHIPPTKDIPRVLNDIDLEIRKMETVLDEQKNTIVSLIKNKIGTKNQPGKYSLYRLFFKKQKEIYLNLGKCKATNTFFQGEIWVLDKKMDEILNNIIDLSKKNPNYHGMNIIDIEKRAGEVLNPPTFIEANEFIWPFQEIVNTYGIPRYQEINPTVFNIVTFPFLFGVMFGDIGHGFILLLFGIYLCLFSNDIKNNKNSLLRPIIQGRWLILLMGIFAFYCGWIYNELFSIALPFFGGTCYIKKTDLKNGSYEFTREKKDCIYPFGMDPKWQMAMNELSFHNSVKMKLSVILGVFHMLFGIILKGFNFLHFKNKLGFIFEFIPQIIFMSILFGYMDIMIFLKWIRDWSGIEKYAPSLITILMNIFLKMGSVVKNYNSIFFYFYFYFYFIFIYFIFI